MARRTVLPALLISPAQLYSLANGDYINNIGGPESLIYNFRSRLPFMSYCKDLATKGMLAQSGLPRLY